MPIKPDTLQSAPASGLTGRMCLAMMLAFFLVVCSVNAVMMTLAIRTMPGSDAKSAYDTSQKFNREIARMQAQAARGWQAQADIVRDGDGARITLVLNDRSAIAVPGLMVTARLQHPASRQLDREARLVETAAGVYDARLAGVLPGAWTLAVEAVRDGEPLFSSRTRFLMKE